MWDSSFVYILQILNARHITLDIYMHTDLPRSLEIIDKPTLYKVTFCQIGIFSQIGPKCPSHDNYSHAFSFKYKSKWFMWLQLHPCLTLNSGVSNNVDYSVYVNYLRWSILYTHYYTCLTCIAFSLYTRGAYMLAAYW